MHLFFLHSQAFMYGFAGFFPELRNRLILMSSQKKMIMHDGLKRAFAKCLSSALKKISEQTTISIEDLYAALETPPDRSLGDLCFPTFGIARALKSAPPRVAAELSAELERDPIFQKVSSVGPFVNVHFSTEFLVQEVLSPIRDGSFFERDLVKCAPKTMIEYSQPNTHKELHVGHMRNICLGNALVRLHRYSGYEVVSSTFPGDVGTHVAKCLWYLDKYNKEPVPIEERGAWLGRMYTLATRKLEEEKENDQAEASQAVISEILKQIESKSGPYFERWKETREWSIASMKEAYAWAGVTFDQWYWESEVDSESVGLVRRLYEEGKLTLDRGAIGMNLEDEGLGFCLLLKSDGNGLYATKDLLLAVRKFEDFKIEKSIYVVDVRQSYHFKQVFAVLKRLGYEQASSCYHLAYNYVELPDGAMSSRKGNIVPLMELIRKMEQTIKERHLEQYRGLWSDEEIEGVAKQVAGGAIKFGMTRTAPGTKIVFDMNEWLKLDGESGPYVQYSHARIRTLVNKGFASFGNECLGQGVNWALLETESERALMIKLSDFNNVVLAATETYKTNLLCTYLFELSKIFNSFYANCRVLEDANESLSIARLALCDVTAKTLAKGLDLLGIEAPERM